MRFIYTPFLVLLLAGCSAYDDIDRTPSVEGDITDKLSWYNDIDDAKALRIDVDIPVPNDYQCAPYTDINATPRECTLADIDGDINPYDQYKPKLHVALYTDDFNQEMTVNASMKQKGKSTRETSQKSYRIKLDSKEELYLNERTLQLNKHAYDHSRVRNKLSFELFETIPNIPSLKTRFVHLFVNNEDYGLFTHVEKVDDLYLKNRGWNEEDNLYKIQEFDFRMSDDLRLDKDGKPLDKDAFELRVELESGKEYRHFIKMVEDVESATQENFEKIFNKYFNRENYITWMASNIILGNKDTTSQNFFLYNPKFSDTYYFIPWDYDGISQDESKYSKWEHGVANWWSVPLHQNFLKIAKNREDLDTKVKELRAKYITDTIIKTKLAEYKKVVEPFLETVPDSKRLSVTDWQTEIDSLPQRIQQNIDWYNEEKGSPMPFWQIAKYDTDNKKLTLWWGDSYDLEGDKIVYDVELADNLDFNNSIVSEKNLELGDGKLQVPEASQEYFGTYYYQEDINLAPGIYYMRVTAKEKNNSSHWQYSFDKVITGDKYYFGTLAFEVK